MKEFRSFARDISAGQGKGFPTIKEFESQQNRKDLMMHDKPKRVHSQVSYSE